MTKAVAGLALLTLLAATSAYTGQNRYSKVAVHIEAHDPTRGCVDLPDLQYCSDIVYTYLDCGEIDVFTVFFDMYGCRALEHGLEWPAEWGSGVYTHCGELAIGNIRNPGDGIAVSWTTCQMRHYIIPGWLRLNATTPGLISPIPNPATSKIAVAGCDFQEDEPWLVFCGGACGAHGDPPCGYEWPLDISKRDGMGGACVLPGDTISYTLVYENPDWWDRGAEDVVMRDQLPPELEFLNATGGGLYDEPEHRVEWQLGTIAPGAGDSVQMEARVRPEVLQGTLIENYCYIAYRQGVGEFTCSTQVCQFHSISLGNSAQIEGGCAGPGDTVICRIEYSTAGEPADVHNVILTDHLPECLEFVSASGGGSYDPLERTITWGLGTLPPEGGGIREVTAVVTWDCSPGDTLENICSITSDETGVDGATAKIPLCPFGLMVLSKTDHTGGSCINPGDSILYHIEYGNPQPVDLHDVILTDQLSGGTALISMTGNGDYHADTHTITWTIGDLPAGSGGSEEVWVRIREDWIYVYVIENRCQISSAETGPMTEMLRTHLCGTGREGMVAVHVLPRDEHRTCQEHFPDIEFCEEILWTEGSCEVDFFPVFFALDESNGFDYGLTWPQEWGSVAFVSCSDITQGNIALPGDGISQSWSDCRTDNLILTGYGRVDASGPGRIEVVPHPSTGEIEIITCHYGRYAAVARFAAGVCGAEGDEPCPGGPQRVEPTTWGAIKAMFR